MFDNCLSNKCKVYSGLSRPPEVPQALIIVHPYLVSKYDTPMIFLFTYLLVLVLFYKFPVFFSIHDKC